MIRVLGLNHRTSTVAHRERIAVNEADLPAVLEQIRAGVVLSTCNRTEVYLASTDSVALAHAKAFFSDRLPGDLPDDIPPVYDLHGDNAVRHLYSVAAGLDSMVLGETQILGQVRSALDAAVLAGTAGPVLTHVFREALRVGRRARQETFIARHSLSVSYAAVELAKSVLGDLRGRQVLVVGAGETGELTAKALVANGVGVLSVANRTVERAQILADQHGGEAVPLTSIPTLLHRADIVIASTDAPDYVVTLADVRAAMTERLDRPLFVIDIALPRDVDPRVRQVAGVTLYDLDDLKARCEHNRERRRDEVERVHAIIDEETERMARWWKSRAVVPTIVDLRAHAERVRREELDEALARLRQLTAEECQIVDSLSRAIVNKLLHRPTVALKAGRDGGLDGQADVIRELFGLG